MGGIDGLWLNCYRKPQDFLANGVLADRLQELGADLLAESIRGPEGKDFALAGAEIPHGTFVLRLYGMTGGEQLEATKEIIRDNLDCIIDSERFCDVAATINACE